jgi:hypothetical protein
VSPTWFFACTVLSPPSLTIRKYKQEIAGGAASARGNCANMTRRARMERGGRASSPHRKPARATRYKTRRERDAARALFYRSRACSICMYMRARSLLCVCVCVCVNTRRCWRDLCAAATMQTAGREHQRTLFGVGQNQNHF